MSIVRIGLAETKKFAEGYSAIFGNKKKKETEKPVEQEDQAKQDDKKDAKAPKKKGKK